MSAAASQAASQQRRHSGREGRTWAATLASAGHRSANLSSTFAAAGVAEYAALSTPVKAWDAVSDVPRRDVLPTTSLSGLLAYRIQVCIVASNTRHL